MKNRLSKILAAAGVASRRASEEIIFAGRVLVNGEKVLLPQTVVDLHVDEVLVDNQPIAQVEQKVTYLLNKPKGFVCTSQPSKNHKRVIELFAHLPFRLFTVGRLDKETTGLLLVTNDGQLSQQVIHPSSGIQKEYLAKVSAEITLRHLQTLSQGCPVEGVFVKPLKVTKVRRNTLKITVAEGRKREVRVILQNAGLECLELCRIRLGNLHLGKLTLGAYKPLSLEALSTILN